MGKLSGHLYKIGDKLRITKDKFEYKKGDIVTVTDIHAKAHSDFDYQIERIKNGRETTGYVAESFVELAVSQPVKPPVGLRPKYIAQAARLQEIEEAMMRYLEVHKMIPGEWLVEYHELWNEVGKR